MSATTKVCLKEDKDGGDLILKCRSSTSKKGRQVEVRVDMWPGCKKVYAETSGGLADGSKKVSNQSGRRMMGRDCPR